MKSYTDIEQSKKLAKILPSDTADMWWSKNFLYYNPTVCVGISSDYTNVYTYKWGDDDIPCWSLTALLDVLPISIDDGRHCLALINSNPNGDIEWLCCYEDDNGNILMECYADNQVDACVEMIIKLHEQKLL